MIRRRTHQAFTLIELLVVIAVIAALAGLLVPVLVEVKTKAKLTLKVNNLRQIWIAQGLYSAENNNRIVPAQDITLGGAGQNWRKMLIPYLDSDHTKIKLVNQYEIFVDPFFEGYDPSNAHLSGYAINLRPGMPEDDSQNVHWNEVAANWEREYRMIAITEPASRIFLADSSVAWFYKDDDAVTKLDMTRHDGKGMALMYDGSTRLLTLDQAVVATANPTDLKNF